jgi:hypothetical protein
MPDLSKISPFLARTYFRNAMRLCRLTGTQPSLLLHSLDFLDGSDAPGVAFFPAMDVPFERKVQLIGDVLQMMAADFTIVNMRRHAESLRRASANLTVLTPSLGRCTVCFGSKVNALLPGSLRFVRQQRNGPFERDHCETFG